MEDHRQETAGTPPPDDRDASEGSTTGTPETDGRDAQGDGSNTALALVWKENLEKERQRANALEARLTRIEQERRPQTPAAGDGSDPRAKREKGLRYYADAEDPVAAEVLELREQLRETINGIGVMSQINAIEDADERAEVRRRYLESLEQ